MSGMFHLLSDDSPPCSPRPAAGGGSAEVDYVAIFKAWRDADPIMAGMQDGTISWADACDLDDRDWAARGGRPVVLEAGFTAARPARYRAPRPPLPPVTRFVPAAAGGGWVSTCGARVVPRAGPAEALCARVAPARACGGGHTRAVVDLALREQVGGLGREMVRREDEITTALWSDVRSSSGASAGEEECRFFNSPAGCRNGDDCPYVHVKRSLAEIRCRFIDTERGCRPSRGVRCPYKH